MKSKLPKILSAIFVSVMVIIVLSNIYILIARKVTGESNPTVFGFTSAIVLTGSMEDAISANDMVITCKQHDYAVNDIVMYKGNTSSVTHRIIKLGENGGYITKGDANNTDDGEISKERIIGRVILIIPKIGEFILFLQSPLGMMVMVIILVLIIELPVLFGRKKDGSKKEN